MVIVVRLLANTSIVPSWLSDVVGVTNPIKNALEYACSKVTTVCELFNTEGLVPQLKIKSFPVLLGNVICPGSAAVASMSFNVGAAAAIASAYALSIKESTALPEVSSVTVPSISAIKFWLLFAPKTAGCAVVVINSINEAVVLRSPAAPPEVARVISSARISRAVTTIASSTTRPVSLISATSVPATSMSISAPADGMFITVVPKAICEMLVTGGATLVNGITSYSSS